MATTKIRHLRMAELCNVYFRECGRKDPLWDRDTYCSGFNRKNEWGLNSVLAKQLRDAEREYLNERDLWNARRNVAIRNEETFTEIAPAQSEIAGIPELATRGIDHVPHIRIIDGRLVFFNADNSVELARFVGHRKDLGVCVRKTNEHPAGILLNGDGFDDTQLQQIQADLRRRAHQHFRTTRTMIVPYMALTAAQVEIDSIRRVETTMDSRDDVPVPLGEVDLRPSFKKFHEWWVEARKTSWKNSFGEGTAYEPLHSFYISTNWKEYELNGRKFRATWSGTSTNESEEDAQSAYGSSGTRRIQIWHQPENGQFEWAETRTTGPTNKKGLRQMEIITRVHRLGATLFTAMGPDGERHRFLSAFDSNEPEPMYFLAQLPDEGQAKTYTQALDVLAPPIVHEARQQGRAVYRQGDVFFVESKITDADLKARKAVISTGITKNGTPVPKRNIYGTGHIATSVARQSNGVTFARGLAEHYPAFTEPDRQPEHRAIELQPGTSWFLAVRNTVPRNASTTDSSPSAADAKAAIESVAASKPTRRKKEATTNGANTRSKTAV